LEQYRALLLDVWREACRHIEIGESTATITALLRPYLPIRQLLVRRFDWQRACVETVAAGLTDPAGTLPEVRTECSESQRQGVLAWSCGGSLWRRSDPSCVTPEMAALVPPKIAGDVVAGPLGDLQNPSGVLVVVAADGATLEPCHLDLVRLLLEPFSVAMENDHRLREMAALREAAEADKRSLLSRLGRKALGDTVVGADSGLRMVMDRVELVARSDVPVLIVGETGTGKELVARLIHNRSPRASGPFIRVNCGAIPPELIDSQLFGHERGAFTGAVEARQGWFERADGGTLLLDEMGELPLAAQVRLLRILQDGWLERVGGHNPIHVDVRIVAATHRDLAAMASAGKFREDLWYRIAVFPIPLPPLRERKEDIPALAAHFADRAATRFGLALVMPSAQDVVLLQGYPWPGNIRELATVIDRAAILGNGRRLEVATALGAGRVSPVAPPQVEPAKSADTAPRPQILPLDEVTKRHIESALSATHGRIEGPYGAARLLQINPHTLRARMRKLRIDWTKFRTE
jgi:transcriptional regulator with GAF, ATPase, and Fis domain